MCTSDESVMFRVDMRGPSRAADTLDCVVAFPAAIERMRAAGDLHDLPHGLVNATHSAFQDLEDSDRDGLLIVAASAQDLLYRHIMEIMILDDYTRTYCSLVMRAYFRQLSEHGIKTFYILDNTLREDRFLLLLELFELSGIVTVTPRNDGTSWPGLSAKILSSLETVGHVAYIEPDAEVNYLAEAQQIGSSTECVATYRNLAPNDPQYQLINIKCS